MSDAKNHIVDKSKAAIPAGTMEDFKRPNHTDFMDVSELAKVKFSGLRHNSVTDEAEIWIDGECRKRISQLAISINPQAIEEALEGIFKL